MMACIASLITATAVSAKVRTLRREAARPPGAFDWEDGGDSADVDWGGFDGD